MKNVVIVSYARTGIGAFQGALSSMSAPAIGAVAIEAAIHRAQVKKDQIQEVFLGNVVSAGIGQAPAKQAILKAGLPTTTPCTTINKVCASGMKSIALAAQSIALGNQKIMVAGGFESMSNVPYYLPQARSGYRLGNGQVVDGVVHDGLWDPYNDQHMGMCGEVCASTYGFSKADQDAYAIESYTRATKAAKAGCFREEITPVLVPSKRRGAEATRVEEDAEILNMDVLKLPAGRPAFQKENGTITAANASSLNDGAAAMVLMCEDEAKNLGLEPLARIRGYGDASKDPVEFTTAPAKAVPVALAHAGLSLSDIDYHEINEAFSVVALANMHLLDLDHERVNVNGGAVALGHPIGMSGCRIVGALYHVLKQKDATFGCASICNGGGGAGAMIIERLV